MKIKDIKYACIIKYKDEYFLLKVKDFHYDEYEDKYYILTNKDEIIMVDYKNIKIFTGQDPFRDANIYIHTHYNIKNKEIYINDKIIKCLIKEKKYKK